MALTCDAPSLVAGSSCIECSLTHKQLLAALVYVLCQVNNMNCTASSLAAASECLRCAMTEKSLLAAAVYILCTNGAGGGGGTAPITQINVPGPPAGNPPTYSNFVVDSNGRVFVYWQGTWH